MAKIQCEELDRFRREVAAALREAKKIRRATDLSIHEDAELSRESHRKINALIKHLLVGHNGRPCPAGDRPIVARTAASA
jgi:hypothetical protein